MTNLKSITELPVADSADGLNLIVNDNGSAKQIPASAVGAQADFSVTDENSPAFIKNKPVQVQADWTETDTSSAAFIKNKPKKELVYEWKFSANDEVYEVFENVNEDLSWLTKYQDDVGFEISAEFYGYDYRYTPEEGDHDYVYYENIYSMVNSTESPNCGRYANVPHWEYNWFTIKEQLAGYISSGGYYADIFETGKTLCIEPCCYFEVTNGVHYEDTGDTPMPSEVENGGFIGVYADAASPFKSVKIYKVTY